MDTQSNLYFITLIIEISSRPSNVNPTIIFKYIFSDNKDENDVEKIKIKQKLFQIKNIIDECKQVDDAFTSYLIKLLSFSNKNHSLNLHAYATEYQYFMFNKKGLLELIESFLYTENEDINEKRTIIKTFKNTTTSEIPSCSTNLDVIPKEYFENVQKTYIPRYTKENIDQWIFNKDELIVKSSHISHHYKCKNIEKDEMNNTVIVEYENIETQKNSFTHKTIHVKFNTKGPVDVTELLFIGKNQYPFYTDLVLENLNL